MKKLALAWLLVPAVTLAAPTTWNVDASHSRVGFGVKHLVISTVRGEFTKYDAKISLDPDDLPRSTVEATVDVASIDTRVADRDAHLRSPDFFDVARFPKMTFRSTKVEKAGADQLRVTGDLSLHGVTKPVVLTVTTTPSVKGMQGETRRGFTASTKIRRQDFGLTWNKVVEAGPAVGDVVAIDLDLEAVAEPTRTAAN